MGQYKIYYSASRIDSVWTTTWFEAEVPMGWSIIITVRRETPIMLISWGTPFTLGLNLKLSNPMCENGRDHVSKD